MHYILRGQYEAALRQLEGAKSSGNSPAEVESLRGLALLLAGDAQRAIASFDRALELQPSFEDALFNRALARLRVGDFAAASADLERLFRDESSRLRPDAAYHHAIALDRLGRTAEAEKWLDRALALDPRLDAALLYVGLLRERRGDLQGAGRAYLDYLEMHPDSPVAALRFAIAAQRSGRADVAKTYFSRVIASAPRSPEAIEAQKYLVMWE